MLSIIHHLKRIKLLHSFIILIQPIYTLHPLEIQSLKSLSKLTLNPLQYHNFIIFNLLHHSLIRTSIISSTLEFRTQSSMHSQEFNKNKRKRRFWRQQKQKRKENVPELRSDHLLRQGNSLKLSFFIVFLILVYKGQRRSQKI